MGRVWLHNPKYESKTKESEWHPDPTRPDFDADVNRASMTIFPPVGPVLGPRHHSHPRDGAQMLSKGPQRKTRVRTDLYTQKVKFCNFCCFLNHIWPWSWKGCDPVTLCSTSKLRRSRSASRSPGRPRRATLGKVSETFFVFFALLSVYFFGLLSVFLFCIVFLYCFLIAFFVLIFCISFFELFFLHCFFFHCFLCIAFLSQGARAVQWNHGLPRHVRDLRERREVADSDETNRVSRKNLFVWE